MLELLELIARVELSCDEMPRDATNWRDLDSSARALTRANREGRAKSSRNWHASARDLNGQTTRNSY